MYLSILRMPRHLLGLLVTTFLCWILCQGEIKFYSDDVTCSQNGTTKLASRQKTVSVIFCVKLGSTDVLHKDVYITCYPQSHSDAFWYRLNNTDRRRQVSSLTKASYTTINITFTKLELWDFNEKCFVSVYRVDNWDSSLREEVEVWFILKEETEAADKTSTSRIPETRDTSEKTTKHVYETRDVIPDAQSKEVNRFLAIGITAGIVLILCTTTGSLIYCCRRRSVERSRQPVSGKKEEDSDKEGNSRDRSTCPDDLSSPYTQYEEIRNVETGSRESSSVLASREFSDIQREKVEYEIPVQVKPRDVIPYCYVELMDDPSEVPATSVSSAAGKGISQFSKVVEYENTLPVLLR